MPQTRKEPYPIEALWAILPSSPSTRSLSLRQAQLILGYPPSMKARSIRPFFERALGRPASVAQAQMSFEELVAVVDWAWSNKPDDVFGRRWASAMRARDPAKRRKPWIIQRRRHISHRLQQARAMIDMKRTLGHQQFRSVQGAEPSS